MDVVFTVGSEGINSVDETKTIEETITTGNTIEIEEGLEKHGGSSGFGSRVRRKSKYMCHPYINIEPKKKHFSTQREDLRTHGSSSYSKLCRKRFRKNWNRKFISGNMSTSPEFINASAAGLLSGLHSAAVDCTFPMGNKSFDLVEQFFSRYRISTYHDEAELATSPVNAKEEEMGKAADSDDSLCPEMERKLKQKEKVEEVTSVHQPPSVDPNLNEGPEEHHQSAQITIELPDLNATVTECNSNSTGFDILNSNMAIEIPDLNAPCAESSSSL